jgi:hypothetical protein
MKPRAFQPALADKKGGCGQDIQIPSGLAPGTYPIQIQMGSFLSNAPLITTN